MPLYKDKLKLCGARCLAVYLGSTYAIALSFVAIGFRPGNIWDESPK